MKTKYIKEEDKILVGRKVKIKTIPNPLIARASKNNLIEVSENLKNYLGRKGYEQILLHETGHLKFINTFILAIPSIIFVISVFYFVFNILDRASILNKLIFYLWFILLLFVLQCICYWIIEILADRFAVRNIKNSKQYEETLNKVYKHFGYLGNNSWLYRNYYHPPKKLRFWFIRKFAGKSSKKNL